MSIAGPGTTAPVSSLRPPGEGATPSYERSCALYRAVDEADLERIQQIDGYRVAPGMTEGKHFHSSATQGSSFVRMPGGAWRGHVWATCIMLCRNHLGSSSLPPERYFRHH